MIYKEVLATTTRIYLTMRPLRSQVRQPKEICYYDEPRPRPELPIDVDHAIKYNRGLRRSELPKQPTGESIGRLLDACRQKHSYGAVEWATAVASREWNCRREIMVLMAIDPSTGDSMLHAAAAANNIPAAQVCRSVFIPGQAIFRRNRYLFNTHRNHAGDTALHIAARVGDVDLVEAIYPHYRSVQYDNTEPIETWHGGSAYSHLGFIACRNKAGRDALAEARLAGNNEVASSLEEILSKLDPEGRMSDESEANKAWQAMEDVYIFNDMTPEPESDSDEELESE